MNKKIKNLLYFLLLTLGIISCRQEEGLSERNDEQKTFSLFNKKNYENSKSSQNDSSLGRAYALDFLQAYYSYDLKHNTNYTGLNVKAPAPDSFINFRVHSQVIEDEKGNIYMVFPKIKNEKVYELYFSTINKENTFLGLFKLENATEKYDEYFSAFENAYNYPNANITANKYGGYGDIEEVIISGPLKPVFNEAPVLPGECEMYGYCNGGGSSGGSGGGSGGGNTPVLPPPPPPNVAISDLKDYLKCLNITQPANLKVYAQQMFGGNGVGHAFISITQGNNTMTFGFYPKNGLPQSITGPGIFGDDSGHAYTHSWNVGTISPTQLQQIIAASVAYSGYTYDVGFNNCADFTLNVLSYAGVSTNTSGIDTPTTVANLIGGLPQSGTAPATQRTCN